MKHFALLAIGIVLLATNANAQTLPFYDSDALVSDCLANMAKEAKQTANVAKVICTSIPIWDGAIRLNLKNAWDTYDRNVKIHCIAEIANGNDKSYTLLAQCIDRASP